MSKSGGAIRGKSYQKKGFGVVYKRSRGEQSAFNSLMNEINNPGNLSESQKRRIRKKTGQ